MIRIAIVDDEKGFLKNYRYLVEKEFINNQFEVEIKCFYESADFYEQFENSNFDIVFMDIDMPGISGIQLAAEIRKRKLETVIVFVSSHSNLVFESIHYAPYRFIQKDTLESDTAEAIQAYCQMLHEENNIIQLKVETGEVHNFYLMKIQYFYSVRHDLFFVYSKEKNSQRLFTRRYTMDVLEKMLKEKGFIRIHKSYIVNSKSIHQILSDKVILCDGSELPISRSNVASIKKQFQIILREDDEI